jgi:hypothetical protein
VIIAKANVNEELNSCIIDGKLYVNKVDYCDFCVCVAAQSVAPCLLNEQRFFFFPNLLLFYWAGRLIGDIFLLTVYKITRKNGYDGSPGLQSLFVLANFLVVIFLVQLC